MANRRMFSKRVVQSSDFLRMPISSRLLYYDLGMSADDDGFVEWFSVMRMTGASEQDLQVLKANGFIHVYDDKVLVIMDWRENNYLRADRYSASPLAAKYGLDTDAVEHGRYLGTPAVYQRVEAGVPDGIPAVATGKDRIELEKGKDTTSPIGEGAESSVDVPKAYGKADINSLMAYWKELFGSQPDGNSTKNRQAAQTLLQRAAKDEKRPEEVEPLDFVKTQIEWVRGCVGNVPAFPTVANFMDVRDKQNAMAQAVNRFKLKQHEQQGKRKGVASV